MFVSTDQLFTLVLNNDDSLQYGRRVCSVEPLPLIVNNYFTKFENQFQFSLITMARMVSGLLIFSSWIHFTIFNT